MTGFVGKVIVTDEIEFRDDSHAVAIDGERKWSEGIILFEISGTLSPRLAESRCPVLNWMYGRRGLMTMQV